MWSLLWFLIVLAIIMLFSKWDLGFSMIIGSIILALATQINVFDSFGSVLFNNKYLLLALSMAIIPILGGIMQDSGMMIDLIHNMNVTKKVALMISPALFGLLPMPGGALMSAPLVDQIAPDLDKNQKVAINVWYRHALLLIYPVSSAILIASSLSQLTVYLAVGALLIPAFIMFIVGYYLLIRPIKEKDEKLHGFNLKIVIRNFFPIILAVIIDFIGRFILNPIFGIVPEFFLFIGLCLSVTLALYLSKTSFSSIFPISKKMKVWKYPILIIAMFFFLDVFTKSGVPEMIGDWELPLILFLVIGFFLGYSTGRIQIPSSIMIPILLIQFGYSTMPLHIFSLLYFSVFLGYIITPIHPCIAYSLEFFETDYKNSFKHLIIPTSVCFFGVLIISLFFSF